MARLALRRWRLPGTEIDFVQVRDGPRAGEYVVSAETVDRLPEFYAKVANLPYKPGAAKQLNEVFRRLSSGGDQSLYEAFASSPAGLAAIVPPRWMLNLPVWSKVPLAGVTAWQWLGLSIGLLFAGSSFSLAIVWRAVASTAVRSNRGCLGGRFRYPLSVNLITAFLVPLLCTVFRIGGPRASSSLCPNDGILPQRGMALDHRTDHSW